MTFSMPEEILNSEQIEAIKQEIYTLGKNLHVLNKDKLNETNIIPKFNLINTSGCWIISGFRIMTMKVYRKLKTGL